AHCRRVDALEREFELLHPLPVEITDMLDRATVPAAIGVLLHAGHDLLQQCAVGDAGMTGHLLGELGRLCRTPRNQDCGKGRAISEACPRQDELSRCTYTTAQGR